MNAATLCNNGSTMTTTPILISRPPLAAILSVLFTILTVAGE